jgi:hypothetical protein
MHFEYELEYEYEGDVIATIPSEPLRDLLFKICLCALLSFMAS